MSKVGELLKSGVEAAKGFSPANIAKNVTKEGLGKLFDTGVEIFTKVQEGKMSFNEAQIELEKQKLLIEADADKRADELETAYLNDTADARDMNKVAIQSEDKFVRRFIYYFAAGAFGVVSLMAIMLFYVEIPAGNERVLDMTIGSMLGALLTIFAFFYGSTKGSKDKTEIMGSLLSKK